MNSVPTSKPPSTGAAAERKAAVTDASSEYTTPVLDDFSTLTLQPTAEMISICDKTREQNITAETERLKAFFDEHPDVLKNAHRLFLSLHNNGLIKHSSELRELVATYPIVADLIVHMRRKLSHHPHSREIVDNILPKTS